MSQTQIDDVRKTLLKLYSDNTLEFAGFGLGIIVALATELSGHDEISTLYVPLTSTPLFLPVLLSTLTFGAGMFLKSAYWGRASAICVMMQSGFHPRPEEPDLMHAMYDYHTGQIVKTKGGGWFVYAIGHLSFWWVVVGSLVAFAIGAVV